MPNGGPSLEQIYSGVIPAGGQVPRFGAGQLASSGLGTLFTAETANARRNRFLFCPQTGGVGDEAASLAEQIDEPAGPLVFANLAKILRSVGLWPRPDGLAEDAYVRLVVLFGPLGTG